MVFAFSIVSLACLAPGITPTLPLPTPRVTTPTLSTTSTQVLTETIYVNVPTRTSTSTLTSLPLKTRTPTPSKVSSLPTILPSATPMVYVVQRGDTLSSIAVRFCGRQEAWPRLAQMNDIGDPNQLLVGQTLLIECG